MQMEKGGRGRSQRGESLRSQVRRSSWPDWGGGLSITRKPPWAEGHHKEDKEKTPTTPTTPSADSPQIQTVPQLQLHFLFISFLDHQRNP